MMFQNACPTHFTKVSPTLTVVRRALLAMQDCMPFRLHSVHFLHTPSFITTFINLFFPLLKPKLTQKVREARFSIKCKKVRGKTREYNFYVCSFIFTMEAARNCTLTWTRKFCPTSGVAKRALFRNSMVNAMFLFLHFKRNKINYS